MPVRKIAYAALALLAAAAAFANEPGFVKLNDVTWTSLGTNENSSMPIGNGDFAANVWTEQNGDILLLLSKDDAWSENGQLLKLGRVRVKLTPNPFVGVAAFRQTLRLETGEIQLATGPNNARIWADANRPVIHIEVEVARPVEVEADVELWRTKQYHLDQQAVQRDGFFEWGNDPDGLTFDPDTVLPNRPGRVSWCHFNARSLYPLIFDMTALAMPRIPNFTPSSLTRFTRSANPT